MDISCQNGKYGWKFSSEITFFQRLPFDFKNLMAEKRLWNYRGYQITDGYVIKFFKKSWRLITRKNLFNTAMVNGELCDEFFLEGVLL